MFKPWEQDFGKYFGNLVGGHVGLAPLADNIFTRSKSYVKALEFGARGIPVIANDAGPYRDLIIHNTSGFLAEQGHDWSRYLRMLGNDEDLRREMGAADREQARGVTNQAYDDDWLTDYQSVLP